MSKTETIENKRRRLIFRSDHRGTKEMDLVMGTFALKYVPEFDEEQLAQYDEILNESDPDLYNWVTGIEDFPQEKMNSVFEKLLKHKYA
jgi:antitoxin CptB